MRRNLRELLLQIIDDLDGDLDDGEVEKEKDGVIKMIKEYSGKPLPLKVELSQEIWSRDYCRPSLKIRGHEPVGGSTFAKLALESAVAGLLLTKHLHISAIVGDGLSIDTTPTDKADLLTIIQEIERIPIMVGETFDFDAEIHEDFRVLSRIGYYQSITLEAEKVRD